MFVQELYGVFTAGFLRYSMFLLRGVMWNGFPWDVCNTAVQFIVVMVQLVIFVWWLVGCCCGCQGIYGRHR